MTFWGLTFRLALEIHVPFVWKIAH